MKKIVMFLVTLLFFECGDKADFQRIEYLSQRVEAYYFVKNTSNQPISFEVNLIQDERLIIATGNIYESKFTGASSNMSDSVLRGVVNPNDSVFMAVYDSWENLKNHPHWFTKFNIAPLDGIQMNDPHLLDNWVKYNNSFPVYFYGTGTYTYVPAYLFILNKE